MNNTIDNIKWLRKAVENAADESERLNLIKELVDEEDELICIIEYETGVSVPVEHRDEVVEKYLH